MCCADSAYLFHIIIKLFNLMFYPTVKFSSVYCILIAVFAFCISSCEAQPSPKNAPSNASVPASAFKFNKLTEAEQRVIINKGTDAPFTGELTDEFEEGTYICKQCNAPLYQSDAKFHTSCGWPSFDQELRGAVTKTPDADGSRTEITCARCQGHLGHVFYNENLTAKNARHCVNTSSLTFVAKDSPLPAPVGVAAKK